MLSKIVNPKAAVPDKDVQGYITEWERHLEFYLKETREQAISAPQHRMFMLRMWSAGLRTHLRYFKTTDAEIVVLRQEIFDYVHSCPKQGRTLRGFGRFQARKVMLKTAWR